MYFSSIWAALKPCNRKRKELYFCDKDFTCKAWAQLCETFCYYWYLQSTWWKKALLFFSHMTSSLGIFPDRDTLLYSLRAKSFSPACGLIPSATHTGHSPFIHGRVYFSSLKSQSVWLSYYQLDTYLVNFMLVFALTKNHMELEKILLLTVKAKFKNAIFTTAPFQDVCLGIPTW